MAAAARDIPQASLNRDNLAVVADRSEPATVSQPLDLPTPPNSISPALPAHGLKAQLRKAKLEPIDSDLDLHESPDGHQRSVSPALEASGAITCALLSKYHLPEILLNHGPLAIRHIMGYLTTSVPGFSGIPPTKARRLVVGALEGRGGGGGGGGVDGNVEFEKVGWGRWDARQRGAASRDRKMSAGSPTHLSAIPISGGGRGQDRLRADDAGGSFHFSHDDRDITMMGNEIDDMSMDDSASASCSEAPEEDIDMNDDPEDATDDEDWAAMGAAALRAESYPDKTTGNGIRGMTSMPFSGPQTFSCGMARQPQTNNIDFAALAGTSDAQEREAIEALLRLGSV